MSRSSRVGISSLKARRGRVDAVERDVVIAL